MAETRKLTSASKDGNCMLSFVYSQEVEKALEMLRQQEVMASPRDGGRGSGGADGDGDHCGPTMTSLSLLSPRISPRHLKCLEVTNTDLASISSDTFATRFQERFNAKTKAKSVSLNDLTTPRGSKRTSIEITGLDSIFEDLVSDGLITVRPKDPPDKLPDILNTEEQSKNKTKVQIQINVNEG